MTSTVEIDTPIKHQNAAQLKYGYGAIHLVRIGDYAIVKVEYEDKWYEVIREHLDGNFSHIVEPLGIAAVIEGPEI